MVHLSYKIMCGCGAWRSKYSQSGDADQWNLSFNCDHWKCSVYQWTTLGFFFGANAQVEFQHQPQCKKCGRSWTWKYGTWGWNSGCNRSNLYRCCGNQLLIAHSQSSWWSDWETYALGASIITGNVPCIISSTVKMIA